MSNVSSYVAATATGISKLCDHSHSDVATASVCAWRNHLDHVATVNSETGKIIGKPRVRMQRAEWRAVRAKKTGNATAAAPKKAALKAAPAKKSTKKAAPKQAVKKTAPKPIAA